MNIVNHWFIKMGFQVTFKDGVVIFVCGEEFTLSDFYQFLGILDKLLDKGEPFVFVINASKPKNIPVRASVTLIKWMKTNKPRIPGILVGSAVIFKNPKISVGSFIKFSMCFFHFQVQ